MLIKNLNANQKLIKRVRLLVIYPGKYIIVVTAGKSLTIW